MPLLPSFFVFFYFGVFLPPEIWDIFIIGEKRQYDPFLNLQLPFNSTSGSKWKQQQVTKIHSPCMVLASRLHWRVPWKAVKINEPHTLKLAPSAPFSNRTRSNQTTSGRQLLKTHCKVLQMDGGLPHWHKTSLKMSYLSLAPIKSFASLPLDFCQSSFSSPWEQVGWFPYRPSSCASDSSLALPLWTRAAPTPTSPFLQGHSSSP